MGATCTKPSIRHFGVLVNIDAVKLSGTESDAKVANGVKNDKENHELPNSFNRARRGSVRFCHHD